MGHAVVVAMVMVVVAVAMRWYWKVQVWKYMFVTGTASTYCWIDQGDSYPGNPNFENIFLFYAFTYVLLGPLLLTWLNFNPSMDK